MEVIRTKNLTKYYGKARGIVELNLTVEKGECFGFIGPNGAGKSTTIRTLLGLISPTDGNAWIFGKDIQKEKEEILQNVGYLPSEAVFYPGMQVKDVLKFSADLRKKDCTEEAKKLCDRLQLDRKRKVDELSFGNRKKVAIVCALQSNPELLILDEPTGGLDPLMQKEFVAELFHAAKEKGIHTCLDTSGIAYDPRHPEKMDELLGVTDLVLLDIKNIDPQKHIKLTSQRIDNIIAFAKELDRRNIPIWIRHVYVNSELNTDDELHRLGEFMASLKNIKVLDVLPYHTMGKVKYENLGIAYPLEGIKDASKDEAYEARKKILAGMKQQRRRMKESQN